MESLKQFDDSYTTVDEDDDNYETPSKLYNELCSTYQIFPKLDVAADEINRKCLNFISKEQNALFTEWTLNGNIVSWWCNAPGSIQLEFIARADYQIKKYGMSGLMILPSRVMSTEAWHKFIEGKREYHAIEKRPSFLKHGRKTKNSAQHAYVVVIWR